MISARTKAALAAAKRRRMKLGGDRGARLTAKARAAGRAAVQARARNRALDLAAVSATVVGRNGEIIVQVRGDNTGPHTLENSMRKAYTARTFRSPSGALVERLKANPTLGLIHLTNVIANQGALPIKVGDEVIGAAGASGAPGGEKDEACVKAGIDKVADQLK
jgi:uncharacterized protein GlcG (DUF336 family)